MARLKIDRDPKHPERTAIRHAANILKGGGIVVFPTETVYGLAANAFDRRAVKKIFKVKGRTEKKGLIILIDTKRDLLKIVREIPLSAKKLISKFWPGPLTLIFKKNISVSRVLTGGKDTVAVRLSSHPVARALTRAAGFPITAPSANLSGRKSHRTMNGVRRELGNKKEIEFFLDGGRTPLGKASTIVDVTKNHPRILRKGAITKNDLKKYLPDIL